MRHGLWLRGGAEGRQEGGSGDQGIQRRQTAKTRRRRRRTRTRRRRKEEEEEEEEEGGGRGAFAKGLSSNGVLHRQAGVEAPEQIGRGERQGGVWKMGMKAIVKAHHVVGKWKMKLAADVNTAVKNEFVKKGGVAAAQWVLGKYPRVPGAQLEENEYGQLGALQGQVDPATEWGLRALYRLTAMKAFVKFDCGRRYAAAMLRKSTPLPSKTRVGDLVMYKVVQGDDTPRTPRRHLILKSSHARRSVGRTV